MQFFIFNSPLEQFIYIPIFTPTQNFLFYFFPFISVSNILIIFFFITVFLSLFVLALVKPNTKKFLLNPSRWQILIENTLFSALSLLEDNVQHDKKYKFFVSLVALFFFVLSLCLYGLFPFSYTITSQLIITFAVSLSTFIGIQIISIRKQGLKFFSSFFPSGVSSILSLLIVPIEFISFIFKPISLSIRLFANMMAGHTLLKVICGFIWIMMTYHGLASLAHFFPLGFLIVLFFLEFAVAVIQSFVFTVLVCIYINEIFSSH
jgi:ATP synthase subunit 6